MGPETSNQSVQLFCRLSNNDNEWQTMCADVIDINDVAEIENASPVCDDEIYNECGQGVYSTFYAEQNNSVIVDDLVAPINVDIECGDILTTTIDKLIATQSLRYTIFAMRWAPLRIHHKKRIQKKWLKRYGYKTVLRCCVPYRFLVGRST